MTTWIPVVERLPQEGVQVLVKFPTDSKAVDVLANGEWVEWKARAEHYRNKTGSEPPYNGPTHWMPIPPLTYPEDYMQSAWDDGRRDGLEEAAKKCEDLGNGTSPHRRVAGEDMARAIRKLKDARGVEASAEAPIWRQAFERAMKQTYGAVDPLRPAGQPGSYWRGEHNGIVGALQTLRENFERELARGVMVVDHQTGKPK